MPNSIKSLVYNTYDTKVKYLGTKAKEHIRQKLISEKKSSNTYDTKLNGIKANYSL